MHPYILRVHQHFYNSVTPSLNNLHLFCFHRAKKLIKNAILNNNFLKKLEISQVQEIVNCMYLKNFKDGEYVIKEGGSGNEMYVLAGMSYAVFPYTFNPVHFILICKIQVVANTL